MITVTTKDHGKMVYKSADGFRLGQGEFFGALSITTPDGEDVATHAAGTWVAVVKAVQEVVD